MARVLLLNPPTAGRPILRDFACGLSTKADYYWAPIDLLVLSGILSGDHELAVIDAVGVPTSPEKVLEQARAFRPETVFTLTAAVTLEADDAFLRRLKDATGARIFGMGDVAQFAAAETLRRTEAFDGFVQNFGDPSLSLLAGGTEAGVSSVVLRRPGGACETREVAFQKPLRYPRPRHDLFPLHRYRMPFSTWTKSTCVITAYGCSFPCTFCAARSLPWQLRPLEDVLDELAYVQSLGVEEVFLRDFTFGPTRKRGRELCEAMVAAGLHLRWSAECRVDVLDAELLAAMKAAGCEVILVGIEVGDADVSERLGKKLVETRTHEILSTARRVGIRVLGHFLLGSVDETREQMERTIRFARALPVDYAAFNLYAPRLGTPMRSELVALGKLADGDLMGQDHSTKANGFAALPPAELRRLFVWAVVSFYLRPAQVARLLRVTPWSTLARQSLGVFKSLVASRT